MRRTVPVAATLPAAAAVAVVALALVVHRGSSQAPGSGTPTFVPPELVLLVAQTDAASLPGRQAATAISNLLGVWIQHYAATDLDHLVGVIDRAGGVDVYGEKKSGAQAARALSGDAPGRLLTWRQVLAGSFAAGRSWSPSDFLATDDAEAVASVLPAAEGAKVSPIPATKTPSGLTRPDDTAIASLVSAAFGAPEPVPVPVPVIVLNGSGAPGVGESVAERLVPGGFRIVISGNAASFDHETTLVVANSKELRPEAERARELLGVGTVSVSGVPSGLGDVTIVVGKDYQTG